MSVLRRFGGRRLMQLGVYQWQQMPLHLHPSSSYINWTAFVSHAHGDVSTVQRCYFSKQTQKSKSKEEDGSTGDADHSQMNDDEMRKIAKKYAWKVAVPYVFKVKSFGFGYLNTWIKRRSVSSIAKKHCKNTVDLIYRHLDKRRNNNENKITSFENVSFASMRKFDDKLCVTIKLKDLDAVIDNLNEAIPHTVKERIRAMTKNPSNVTYMSTLQSYESADNEGVGYQFMITQQLVDDDTVSIQLAVSGMICKIGSGVENVLVEDEIEILEPQTRSYFWGCIQTTKHVKHTKIVKNNVTRVRPKEISMEVFGKIIEARFYDQLRSLEPLVQSAKLNA